MKKLNRINYPRIANALYNQVWAITPSMHKALCDAFEHHIKKASVDDFLPDEDEDLSAPANPEQPEPGQGDEDESIALISVNGVLGKHLSLIEQACTGGYDVDTLAAQLKEAQASPDVKAILLAFNSPGGTVTGIPECAELIKQVCGTKPVIAFTDSQMCSGAYWLAAACDAVYCSPSANVGSVGVYNILTDCSKALEKEGVTVNAIVAGKSPMKLAGASFKPLTDEEREQYQANVDKIYSQFVAAITAKRTIAPEALNGWAFDGEDAVKHGLADGLANNLDEVLSLISQP